MGDHPGVNPGVLLQPGVNLLNEADSWDGYSRSQDAKYRDWGWKTFLAFEQC